MLCLPPGGLRLRPFLSFPKRHPVIFGSIFASVKTAVADIIAQKFIEDNETIDVERSTFELFLNSNNPPARRDANFVVTMQMPVSLQQFLSPYLDMSFLVL